MKLTQEEINKLIEEAPKDQKGRPVIPDDIFMDNYRNFPNGVISDAGKISQNCGYTVYLRKGDARTKEISNMGAQASKEAAERRKTFAETIDYILKKKDKDGISNQEKIVLAMLNKASDGCVGAFEALRDTVGEKPTDNVAVDVMTDGDKALMEKLLKRMGYDEAGTTKK